MQLVKLIRFQEKDIVQSAFTSVTNVPERNGIVPEKNMKLNLYNEINLKPG